MRRATGRAPASDAAAAVGVRPLPARTASRCLPRSPAGRCRSATWSPTQRPPPARPARWRSRRDSRNTKASDHCESSACCCDAERATARQGMQASATPGISIAKASRHANPIASAVHQSLATARAARMRMGTDRRCPDSSRPSRDARSTPVSVRSSEMPSGAGDAGRIVIKAETVPASARHRCRGR